MADEVIRQKILMEPEVVQAAASKVEEVIAKAASKGLKKGLMNFDNVIKSYSKALTEAGEAQMAAYNAAVTKGNEIAELLGGTFVEDDEVGGARPIGQIISPQKVAEAAGYASFPEFMRSMYSAGCAPNQIHSQVRSIARDIAGKIQPNLKELNIPLERAAKQLRAFNTQQKAASSASTISQRAGALADILADPNNGLSDEERFALTRAFANQLSSLSNRSFVEKGILTAEESAQFATQAAEVRSQIAGIKQTLKEDAKYSAYIHAPTAYSATEALSMANQAQSLSAATPERVRSIVGLLGGNLSATERYAWAYKYNNENSKFYWDSKFKTTVEELGTSPMNQETRRQFAQLYAEQNAMNGHIDHYWSARRRDAVNNIITGSRMDPEAKEYFKEWVKAQNKNTSSLNSLTSWLRGSGGPIIAGAMATYGVARVASDTVTGIMAGRTSWLADTQNPYDTKRNQLQQWGKKGGFWAGLLGGAAVGTAIAPGIGTIIGGVAGAVGLTSWAQHNMDQKKIADEYAKYSGNLNIQRALYGNNIGYNAANAIQNSNLGKLEDVLSLNTTAAMMPGAMMFGGMSEQQAMALAYMPNFWQAMLNRENPLDILAAYRNDAKNINPVALPYLTSLAGLSESLRGLALSDNFDELYAQKDKWSGMDLAQFGEAYRNTSDAIERAKISQEQLNTQFIEQSQSTRGNGTGGPWYEDINPFRMMFGTIIGDAATKLVSELLMSNDKFGQISIYIDGVKASENEITLSNWVGGQQIYSSGTGGK